MVCGMVKDGEVMSTKKKAGRLLAKKKKKIEYTAHLSASICMRLSVALGR